jgi:hypothetical protein
VDEIGIGRLRRRESIGFVQKAADGDAVHAFVSVEHGRTVDPSRREAQAKEQSGFACSQ